MTENPQVPMRVTAGVQNLVHDFDVFLDIPQKKQLSYNRSSTNKTKYDVFRDIVNMDNEVSSALVRISGVVVKAYDKPAVVDGGNTELLKDAIGVLGEMQFSRNLGSIVTDLSRDGDVIQVPANVYKYSKKTLKELKDGMVPLPINLTTILEDGMVPGSSDTSRVIRKKDWYYVNEGQTSVPNGQNYIEKHPGDIVWHISLSNRTNWSVDVKGRTCFGIYGISPMESLRNMIRWKYQSIRDDIAWRHANVPRTDHALDLDAIMDLNNYSGTMTERYEAAVALAQNVLNDYMAGLTNTSNGVTEAIDVDQGYVHDARTVVKQVGGNNTYADCMPIVKKVDMSIATRLGVPLSALGYESNSSYAIGKVTVTFMNTFGYQLLACIQEGTFDYIKRVLEARGKKYSQEDWDGLYLNYNIADFEELNDVVNAWTMAYKHGVAKLGEARDGIGLSPIKQEDDLSDINNQFHPNLFSSSPWIQEDIPPQYRNQQTDENGNPLDTEPSGNEGGDPGFYASIPASAKLEAKLDALTRMIEEMQDAQS
jgi:hypothetical protein